MDEAKGIVKGYFSDFMNGIRQGKSIWESFADAAQNALNKIIDKLLNNLIDAIFTVNKATGSVGGGGGGGILQTFMGWFGGLFSAKGNVFDQHGVTAFAKGGVVSNPTMFAHAGGIGVMGEAGEEAIMPLKRGPDGSLGIQMHGASKSGGAANQNNITIAPVINVDGSSGNKAQDEQHANRISNTVSDAINKIVDERMLKNTSYGGALNQRGYQGK
jgi:lambda family phage tail tape measure protein